MAVVPTPGSGNRRIPNEVNPDAVKQILATDPLVSQIIKQGKKLLEKTNRPNVITVAQFEPYIPMFNMNVELYDSQRPMGPYIMEMNKLYNRWKNELGINLYELVVIIKSVEDPTVVRVLNRRYMRICSDKVDGMSARENIPSNISKTSDTDRSQEIMKASVHDIAIANSTPEQLDIFAKAKVQSALITKQFVEEHMSPEKRAEIMSGLRFPEDKDIPVVETESLVTFADDDDDD